MNPKAKIYDALCGQGKTIKLIDDIKNSDINTKFLYITPLLSECVRISGSVLDNKGNPILINESDYYYEPSHPLRDRYFKMPITTRAKDGTKMNDLKQLINAGCNIVSTHSLFKSLSIEMADLLRDKGYVLILDEVLTVYETYNELSPKGLETCLDNGWLSINPIDNITLNWNNELGYDGVHCFEELGNLCNNGQLLLIDGNVVIWEFPIILLASFKELWIATYMFVGSQMYSYLKSYGIPMELIKFGIKPSEVKHLINIIDSDKLNLVGNDNYALSYSSLVADKNRKYRNQEILGKNLFNFMINLNKTKTSDRLWTVFKPASGGISKNRFSKSWLACSAKATNNYSKTWAVAYLINVFIQPHIVKLFAKRSCNIDQDLYALSEMIQFIFRSRIREGESIELYIPSSRMRNLFIRWLNNEFEYLEIENCIHNTMNLENYLHNISV